MAQVEGSGTTSTSISRALSNANGSMPLLRKNPSSVRDQAE